MYGRVDLSKVQYELDKDIIHHHPTYEEASGVYDAYCKYKNFTSVIPLYYGDIELHDWNCLYQDGKLVAWEQTKLYPKDLIAHSYQFAWTYDNPLAKIGWRFSHHVPAWLKSKGYKYLYLGDHHDYKTKIQGYEILGAINTT